MRRAAAVAAAAVIFAGLVSGCGHGANSHPVPLRLVRDIPLPGNTSRFDYQDVDAARRRLFVAHQGASRIEVVDLDTLRVAQSMTDVAMVHGVRVAPSLGRVYASATGANQVVTFDEDRLAQVNRVPTGDFPDAIAVDLVHQRVFVSNESDGSETVIDARSGALVGTVELGGDAGNVAVDAASGHVFVAVQSRNELASIDPLSLAIVRRTPLRGCRNDHSFYIDAPARLGFVACDANNKLLVLNLDSMHILATFGLGVGPDVLAFDAGMGRLYVASESGTVSVFAVHGRTTSRLGQTHLADHAHSVAVDPTTHHVFFPLQSVGGRPVLRTMTPT